MTYTPFYGCPVRAAEDELRAGLHEVLPADQASRIMYLLENWMEAKLHALSEKITGSDRGWYD